MLRIQRHQIGLLAHGPARTAAFGLLMTRGHLLDPERATREQLAALPTRLSRKSASLTFLVTMPASTALNSVSSSGPYAR